MGCGASRSELIKMGQKLPEMEEEDEKAEKRVHFREPEYVFLKTPLPENGKQEEGIDYIPTPKVHRKVTSAQFRRTPPRIAIKTPPNSFLRPVTPKKPKTKEIDEVPLPPPRPPRTKRKELFTDPEIFAKIDQHALSAPKSAETSLGDLARYLMLEAENDLEKIRSFYRWITNNIMYDTDAHFRGKRKPSDAFSVLRFKRAVSMGYANIFAEFCKYARLPVKCISGLAKGYDYTPQYTFTMGDDINHTWNAVYVNGDWRIVECAWGAGHLDSKKKFSYSFKDFYFLPDPEHMRFSHFPMMHHNEMDSRPWQFVEEPIDLMKFNKIIKPIFRAFEWGVQFISHLNTVLDVWKKVNVTIQSSTETPLCTVTAQLIHAETGREVRQFTIVQSMEGQKYQVTLRPPIKGKYHLKILGNTDPDDDETHVIVQYFIRCHEAMPEIQPYPDHYGYWGALPNYTDFGISENSVIEPWLIAEGGEVAFSIQTTKKIEAVTRLAYAWGNIPDIDNYAMMESTKDGLHILARLPKEGFYKLKIMCSTEKGDYKACINYLVECHVPATPHAPVPKVFKSARQLECRLLEPIALFLLKRTKTVVRFTSPSIAGATIMGQAFEKVNNNEWEATVLTPGSGDKFMISGGDSDKKSSYKGLYEFKIT